jgi:hypothetical protein
VTRRTYPPDPEPPYDPHRAGESLLAEVRTVLSRAETALETIAPADGGPLLRIVRHGYWDFTGPKPVYVEAETEPHPDGEAIVAALRATIAALEPWRGPNKRRGPR